jgi:hypothetical protein
VTKFIYFELSHEVFDRFENYEISPCRIVGHAETGEIIYEACSDDDPNIAIWCVYGHFLIGGRECISYHAALEEAEEFERTLPILSS